jgi:hypothetical protein
MKCKMRVYIYNLLIKFLKCKPNWCLFYPTDSHCYLLTSTILSLKNLSFFLLLSLFVNEIIFPNSIQHKNIIKHAFLFHQLKY